MGISDPIETLYIPDDMDCRRCNLCANHCPTFKVTRLAEESPRGRLRLIDAVLNQGKQLEPEEEEHLNNCVECRACERVCPSKMRYFKLLTKTKAALPQRPTHPLVKGLLYLTSHRRALAGLFKGLRLYQKWGLQELADGSGLTRLTGTRQLNALLPKLPPYQTLASHYPAQGQRKGSVGLFSGCLSRAMDTPVLHASIKVLTHLGYDVLIPKEQQCCGALHSHNNDKPAADKLAEQNLLAFKDLDVDAIIYTASACGPPLSQYKRRNLSPAAAEAVAKFESRLKEISQFIAEQPWPETLQLEPLHKKIAVHEPCSQQYPLATHKAPYEYLQKIPGLTVEALPENNVCCGAGGSYMLTHPRISRNIRSLKLEHLRESKADLLVTSNIGCALHLAAGIHQQGPAVPVAHPVEVLAGQIADT